MTTLFFQSARITSDQLRNLVRLAKRMIHEFFQNFWTIGSILEHVHTYVPPLKMVFLANSAVRGVWKPSDHTDAMTPRPPGGRTRGHLILMVDKQNLSADRHSRHIRPAETRFKNSGNTYLTRERLIRSTRYFELNWSKLKVRLYWVNRFSKRSIKKY